MEIPPAAAELATEVTEEEPEALAEVLALLDPAPIGSAAWTVTREARSARRASSQTEACIRVAVIGFLKYMTGRKEAERCRASIPCIERGLLCMTLVLGQVVMRGRVK